MIKIAIIEDNKKFRDCLATGLSIFPDCNVIHKLTNALNIETHFNDNEPEIVIIDINMPGIDGVGAVKEISKKFPKAQCIMLTVNVDLDMVLKCMQNGAKGYLLKDKDSIQKIVESIRILVHGNYNEEFPLNGTIAKRILGYLVTNEKSLDQKLEAYHLTNRQAEILKLLYNGKSYKQIASECSISVDTLNSHIRAIYPKLQIKSRGEIKGRLDS
jgi:DNA-binding NarL/FixJ family response regulator